MEIEIIREEKITTATKNFQRFISIVEKPITKEKIINYYIKGVRRNTFRVADVWSKEEESYITDFIDYTPQQSENMAMQWFDRNMGKLIRLNLIKANILTLKNIKKNGKKRNHRRSHRQTNRIINVPN